VLLNSKVPTIRLTDSRPIVKHVNFKKKRSVLIVKIGYTGQVRRFVIST